METSLTIDVTNLDATHRRALEDVIGVQLQAHQRLIIGVIDVKVATANGAKQSVADWAGVYDGLSDDQIETIDRVSRTRADFSRNVP